MSFLDKFKAWFYGISIPVPAALKPETEQEAPRIVCGQPSTFVDPDDLDNFSEHDSLAVDSKEGAPE